MADLDVLLARIPGYAGYDDGDARHAVDKQIRAFLGEALSEARERVQPAEALGERLDGLILRCEFSDQRVIRAADRADFEGRVIDRVHELDRQIVEAADRVRAAAGPEALAAELDVVARCLDERFGAIADAPPA